MTQSPEVTGLWQCPKCPNTTHFVGWDHNGYGGPDACECGAFDDEADVECACAATLRQAFTVVPGATDDGYDGEIIYSAFTGGGVGAEIGSYDTIECAACGAVIWNEVPPEDGP